jgi:hypothetical protein
MRKNYRVAAGEKNRPQEIDRMTQLFHEMAIDYSRERDRTNPKLESVVIAGTIFRFRNGAVTHVESI